MILPEDVGQVQKHREWVEATRKTTRARAVKLQVIPRWLRTRLREAHDREGYGEPVPQMRAFDLLMYSSWRECMDHWGSSSYLVEGHGGRDTFHSFVSEPYPGPGVVFAAEKFAAYAGLVLIQSRPSWWYPHNTIRLEFLPGPMEDSRVEAVGESELVGFWPD